MADERGAVERSRWRYTKRGPKVSALLDALGIDYHKSKSKDFWQANAVVLPELYKELINEARVKFRELHPDTGGDGEEFADFLADFNNAKRLFILNGVNARPKELPSEVRIVPEGASVFERRERKLESKRVWARKAYARNREQLQHKSRERYKRNIDTERKRCRDNQKRFRREVLPTLSAEKQATFWAKSRANSAKWTKENRERHNELNRRWCAKNRDKMNAKMRLWRKNNPDKERERKRRQRLRQKSERQMALAA